MNIATYSMKSHADHKISDNFKVREFACKDKSDEVKIADDLVVALEKIRAYFKSPVNVNSGYRTENYNKKIGGASKSQHVLGTAADIQIRGVSPRSIAQYAESIGLGGIGLYEYSGKDEYRSFAHVDVREKRARWLRTDPSGKDINVSNFNETLRKGSVGPSVVALQSTLGIRATGIYDEATEGAVRAYQIQHSVIPYDGIAGPKTLSSLGLKL